MKNSFEQLNKILAGILKEYGIEKQVKEAEALNIWQEEIGVRIARVTEPLKVADGKLFVKVKSSSWRSELILLKPAILNKINKRLGKLIIKDIVFV